MSEQISSSEGVAYYGAQNMNVVNSVLRRTESVHILVFCLFYDPLKALPFRLFASDISAKIVYVIVIFRKSFYISYQLILHDFTFPAVRRNYKTF
jgi:arginine exporter protein ArgO